LSTIFFLVPVQLSPAAHEKLAKHNEKALAKIAAHKESLQEARKQNPNLEDMPMVTDYISPKEAEHMGDLYTALTIKDTTWVKELLDAKANPHDKGSHSLTPFEYALMIAAVDSVEDLLAAQADPNIYSGICSPLVIASLYEKE
jgi:ankyrin repeat protein